VNDLTVERCPTLEELLQAADCELSPEAHATVLRHLPQCAVCQARDRRALRTLRDVHGYLAGAFGEERQQARQQDFQAGLHKLRQALIHHPIGSPLRRWLPMAALTPVLIVAVLLSRTGTVVLQADELLQRAVHAERMRPRGAIQRVRVRLMPPGALALPPRATASFTLVQELTDGTATVAPAAPAATAAALTSVPMSLAHRLSTHRFDWRRPMDVARFDAWRGTLAHKDDQVIAIADAPLLVLRTTTTDDTDLIEAELTVQRDDYRVVRAAFVFDGVGRLEIEELAQWVRRTVAPVTMRTDAGDAARLAHDLLTRTELSTRLLLAQTGLDLPGTMRVSQAAVDVRIDGTWPSAAQRRALNGRLLALPHVAVHLRLTDRDDSDDVSVASHTFPLRPGSPLAVFLARTFFDTREREAFLPELVRLTTAVRQRLTVLHELAERYPESEVRGFTMASRTTWQQLLEWHYRQLRADLNGLDTRVRVLSGSESRAYPPASLPADWTRRVAGGVAQAITFDRLVQEFLAQQDLPSEQARGQDSLSRTFRALWDAVAGSRQSRAAYAES
jgi:hypothetical protein